MELLFFNHFRNHNRFSGRSSVYISALVSAGKYLVPLRVKSVVRFIHTPASCYFDFSFEYPVFFHNCTMYLYTDMNTLRGIRVRYSQKALIFFSRSRNLPPEADLFLLVFSAFSPRRLTIQSDIFLSIQE